MMQRFWAVFFAVFFGFLQVNSVFAKLDAGTLNFFAQNNILYYDPSNQNCKTELVTGDKVTVIGDSISVGARAEYDAKLPGADYSSKTYNGTTYELTQISKHFAMDADGNYSGMSIVREMDKQSSLRRYVVFALGTNDVDMVTEAKIDELVQLIGTNHKIVLVTNYAFPDASSYDKNNEAIRNAAEKYSGKVAVADWAIEASKRGAELFSSQGGVHPNVEGSKVFVDVIDKALNSFSNSDSSGGMGNNKNYAGVQVWSDAEMEAIQANRKVYEEVANKYHFPWQILAVIHYHESSFAKSNPSNGQGVYQLYGYTGGGNNANRFVPGPISEEEFKRQTYLAADEISEHAGDRDLNDPDNVKWLFFAYNGQASVYKQKALNMGFTVEQANNGEGSPYVMNRADAKRDPTSSGMSKYWPGRYVGDGVYDSDSTSTRFGAFVQYEVIAGTGQCSTGAGGTIAETAIQLSWDGHGHSKNDPKPEYVAAMKEVGSYMTGCGHGTCAPIGASCDQFVGTVMRYSGADPDFPVFGPANQEQHMKDHPDMYVEIQHNNDLSVLEPGDIFVTHGANGNHIYLYVGKTEDGKGLMQASASFNGRTGEHFQGVYFSDHGGARQYKVWRRINF